MPTRAERRQQAKQQLKAHQPGAVAREVVGKGYAITINSLALPTPETMFYANAATMIRRLNVVTFVFGQFAPMSAKIHSAIAIDIPVTALEIMIKTFNPEFVGKLTKEEMPQAEGWELIKASFTYPAHLARITTNDVMGVMDFYDLTPALMAPPSVEPSVRLKVIPPIIRYFFDGCVAHNKEQGAG
jgi:hypothetical protein